MRISTNQIFTLGLNGMLNQQTELVKTQQQIASGEKLQRPSDDPVTAVQILNFEREANLLDQYITNVDIVKNKLSVEEGLLDGVTNVLQRVRELAVQGLNDTYTATDRDDIAQEVKVLNEELLAIANSQDESGNYLFSGFSNNIQPYTSIGASYGGDEGQRKIQVGPEVFVESNDPGNLIFESEVTQTVVTDTATSGTSSSQLYIISEGVQDTISPAVTVFFSAPDSLVINDGTNSSTVTPYVAEQAITLSSVDSNFPDITLRLEGTLNNGDSYRLETQTTARQSIFQTIDQFANALVANKVSSNDSPNNGDILTNLSAAIDNVIDTKAKIGARYNVVEQQQQVNETLVDSVTETLSGLKDLDFSEAISRLSQQSAALQAAQQTFSRVQGLNLFNFL